MKDPATAVAEAIRELCASTAVVTDETEARAVLAAVAQIADEQAAWYRKGDEPAAAEAMENFAALLREGAGG